MMVVAMIILRKFMYILPFGIGANHNAHECAALRSLLSHLRHMSEKERTGPQSGAFFDCFERF